MTTRITKAGAIAGCLLLLALAPVAAAGCSADRATTSTTGTESIPTSTTGGSTTSSTGSLLSEWDRQLRDNAKVQHELAIYLDSIDAPTDDPLMGLYYGLQARTNALTCRKALADGALETADAAMLEVYYALNRGRNLARDPAADTLAGAYAIVEALGAPSKDPENAAVVLDRFLETSLSLVDQVVAIVSAPTTATPPSTKGP